MKGAAVARGNGMRPMRHEDIDSVVVVFRQALQDMRRAIGLPGDYDSSRLDGGVSHLLATDPGGSWIVENEHAGIVGFAQGARRDDLWVLAHLFVLPSSQGAGLGRALLNRSLEYGCECRSGLIASTPFPAAMTLYARLPGFVVHPMVSASGRVDRQALASAPDVRVGDSSDRDLIDAVDRQIRTGSHGSDIDYLLESGSTLYVISDRGYAVAGSDQVDLLAATDEQAARQLLSEALRRTDCERTVTIKRIGAGQPWAVEVAVSAGLQLSPWGPLLARDCPAPTQPYLPDSAFC